MTSKFGDDCAAVGTVKLRFAPVLLVKWVNRLTTMLLTIAVILLWLVSWPITLRRLSMVGSEFADDP